MKGNGIKGYIHILPLMIGVIGAVLGLITFVLSWQFWDVWGQPVPGYHWILAPANWSLMWVWHPLLSEEIALVPKLTLMILSQFALLTLCAYLIVWLIGRVIERKS